MGNDHGETTNTFFILHVLFTTLVIQLKFGKSSLSHTQTPGGKQKKQQATIFLSWSSFFSFFYVGGFFTLSPQERLDNDTTRQRTPWLGE